MALVGVHNIAKMYSSTTGTGTLTLTTAAPLCNTFALAGVADGERVRFVITDPVAGREVSEGIYTSATLTLTRATVLASTNGGSKISCTGRQTVAIVYAAEDIQPFASFYGSTSTNVSDTASGSITLDTELVDQAGIASVSGNQVTPAKKGWYMISGRVTYSAASAFNGKISILFAANTQRRGYTTAMAIQDDVMYFGPILMQKSSDASAFNTVAVTNNLGATITVTVTEFTITRWGNI